MRKIFLLVVLNFSIFCLMSCKRENEVPGNLLTEEAKQLLKTDEGREIYDNAMKKALAEQRKYQNDPALKEYFDHYKRADYVAAFNSVEPVAMAGHSQAQAELASLYLQGQGVPVNINTAVVWLNKSHEQGNLMATATLGGIYFAPNLGHQDYAKSYSHYQICAMQLRFSCIVPFAILHVTNGSGHYDPVTAAAWLEIGVDQDAPGAVQNRDALVPQLSKQEFAQIRSTKLALLESIATQLKRE